MFIEERGMDFKGSSFLFAEEMPLLKEKESSVVSDIIIQTDNLSVL